MSILLLAGCAPDAPNHGSIAEDSGAAGRVGTESDGPGPQTGAAAYETYCASCHDEGVNGAPVTGNPDDWKDRSWLWQAVLFEHANSGYLEMPAKGGQPDADTSDVDRAAQYMLETTFQDLPSDQ